MSKKADLIKKMVKTNVGEKPTYGTDPRDPWSAKANITESALLNRYLKSRGINPEFVSKDQKVAHSKTTQFKTWASSHVNDRFVESISQEHTPTQKRLHILKKAAHMHKEIRVTDGHKQLHSEAVDKKDTITFDIPLLIRVLEFAREDLKSDIELHKMVERLLNIRGKGTLSMNEYGKIVKEEVEALDEISKETLHAYATAGHKKYDQLRDKKDPASMRKKAKLVKGIKKADVKMYPPVKPSPDPTSKDKYKLGGRDPLTGRSWSEEVEIVNEGSSALRFAQALRKEREARELKDKTREAREKQGSSTQNKPIPVPTKEDFFHGSAAAVGMPFDGANNPDDTIPAKRSNQARIVKSVVKKIKEELYDHEKEDKSTAPLGKKVKLQKPGVDVVTKESPQAAAVLSGGKTMTGEPRDTIEIDPMMKMRKQSPDSQKSV